MFLNAYTAGEVAVDALILATPTHTHISMASELLGSSLSVLIEKPLSSTGAEGRQYLEASRAGSKGVYMVGHHRRHNCYVRAIKDVLEKQELGRIIAVNGGEMKGLLSFGDCLTVCPNFERQSGRNASQTSISRSHGIHRLAQVA